MIEDSAFVIRHRVTGKFLGTHNGYWHDTPIGAKIWRRAGHAKSRLTSARNRAGLYSTPGTRGHVSSYGQALVDVAEHGVVTKFLRTWFEVGEVE